MIRRHHAARRGSGSAPLARTWLAIGPALVMHLTAGCGGAPSPGAGSGAPPEGMVFVEGGKFVMGSREGPPDESPPHVVELSPFWIDAYEVTNAEFAAFVEATGYVTFAERPLDPDDFPGAPPELVKPGSIVFQRTDGPVDPRDQLAFWSYVPGASWRHPEGPGTTVDERLDHPVVNVVWEDAQAYARWCGKRLPTEAEWERAARGGLAGKRYPWGDSANPDGRWMMNSWQGSFPHTDAAADGYHGTAPVGSYPPNALGLHDVSGNVWELCQDWYQPNYYGASPAADPGGPGSSYDPREPGVPKRVKRGGSWLSNPATGTAYRVAARHHTPLDSPSNDTGFRCAKDP